MTFYWHIQRQKKIYVSQKCLLGMNNDDQFLNQALSVISLRIIDCPASFLETRQK